MWDNDIDLDVSPLFPPNIIINIIPPILNKSELYAIRQEIHSNLYFYKKKNYMKKLNVCDNVCLLSPSSVGNLYLKGVKYTRLGSVLHSDCKSVKVGLGLMFVDCL